MTRILADLPDDDIAWLDRLAERESRSRAAVLREAVACYRASSEQSDSLAWLDEGFGAWRHRTDIGDAVEWQRRERAGWTRPWDDDFARMQAEFPDCLDAEDERQRRIHRDMLARGSPRPADRDET